MIRTLIIAVLMLTGAAATLAQTGQSRITVDPVSGAAAPFDAAIARKVASELERMGYETGGAAPLRLSGKALAISGKDGAKFDIAWTLSDASGRKLGQFTKSQTAPYKAANPWDALDADTLSRLARASAEAVEESLGDTEAGSSALLSTATAKPQQPMPAKPAGGVSAAATKVFITGVSGAPGDGDIALPNALAIYFGQFDIDLLPAKAPDAYIIEGQVKTKPKNAAQEIVSILWLLKSPKGKELARIAQENAVPAGSLAPHWGTVASYAAEGAADGLLSTMASLGPLPPVK